MLNKFEHDEIYLNTFPRLFNDIFTIAIILDKLNYIRVVQFLEQCHFVEHYLFENVQADLLNVMTFDNFDGIELVRMRL